ncbi:MAG: GbsR/MarR family transcriptional regulator [Nitrospirota bacterium]
MDKDIKEARDKAVEALALAIGFWGIDPLEARIWGFLFLSKEPLCLAGLAEALNAESQAVEGKLKLLKRLGAVKEAASKPREGMCFEAEADFFQILQTVLKERREKEMGAALQEICDQRVYVEYKYEEKNEPELKFMAGRLEKLEGFINLIDRAMFGLKTFAGIRGIFRGRK